MLQEKKKESKFSIDDKALDQLISQMDDRGSTQSLQQVFNGFKKALIERMLQGELTHHLGYDKHDKRSEESGNARNGSSSKTIMVGDEAMTIKSPRDRESSFSPVIVPKGLRRIAGFDDKVISLYARGMSVREIQGHLQEIYQVDVSADLISTVTDEVLDEVKEWQNRPLSPLYAAVFLDCLFIKTRHEGQVKNRAYYLGIGYTIDGEKEVLGLWVEETEGAKFWLKVMTELKNRGVQDILFSCVDGLKGFPEAISAVFPKAQIQTCIVHQIRHCLGFVPWKDRQAVAKDLKNIYSAETVEVAEYALEEFCDKWDARYPAIGASWRRNWEKIIPFLDYPQPIRKMIYTTNAIESLNMVLRKIIKNRGHFPSDEAACKLLYLALKRHEVKNWKKPPPQWGEFKAHLFILFADRINACMKGTL